MKNENIVIIVVIAALAFLILTGGFSGYGMMSWGMMGSYWIFGPVIMVLVTITLVLLIVWLIKQIGGKK